jgi:hypothetical protein
MASTMTTSEPTLTLTGTAPVARRLKVDGSDPAYGDWRDDFVRDGYAVIKGAISAGKVEEYADRMYSLIEGL